MGFWKSVKNNGLRTTFKMIDSKEFQAELFEAFQETYIVSHAVAALHQAETDDNVANCLYL
jgi:hypothetical protein